MRTYHLWMTWCLLFSAACSSSEEPKSTVLPPASIQAFLATPAEVIEGDPIILSWDTKNTSGVRIEDARGKVLFDGNRPGGSFSVVPPTTTLYRLFASGTGGMEVSQQVAVKTLPGPGPEATFKIEPAEIPIGSPIHLIWETTGTTGVTIRKDGKIIYESNRLLSGTIEILAEEAAIYQFTAEGRWGKRELSAEVKVKPVIISFTGGISAPVEKGTDTSLSWKTRGADGLVVRTPEGQSWQVPAADIEAGSMIVPMGESGRFELVAKRGEFEVVQAQDVAPLGAPRINSLVASPSPITEGELFNVTLSWDVDWALGGTLSWDGNVHELGWLEIGKASFDIQVSTETQIVLEARNQIGTSSTTYVLGTIPEPRPALDGPKNVGPDELFSLHWNAPHASEVFLYRDGVPVDIPSDLIAGQVDQQIRGTTTWTLEARNPAGSVRTATHTTRIGAPQIQSFQSDQPRYGAAARVTWSWEVDGGTRLSILDPRGQELPGCNLVEGGGLKGRCVVVAPEELGIHVYTLEVENSEGMASQPVSIRVEEGHSIEWFVTTPEQFVTTATELTLGWLVLDHVDGTRAAISITDNRGGSWQFSGSHLEPGSLSLVAGAPGEWRFRLVASVSGSASLEEEVVVHIEGVPVLSAQASSDHYDLQVREPVVVEWTTVNAARVDVFAVDPAGNLVVPPVYSSGSAAEAARGSVDLVPAWPQQSFEVVAYNLAGTTDRARFDFEVLGNPNGVLRFDVSATTVPRGSSVTLDWATQGSATLAPFYDAPIEVTATSSFDDIHPTGVQMAMTSCGSAIGSNDEGCNIVPFPDGFTFPFDGTALPGVTAFVNSLLSAEMGTSFGSTWSSITSYPSTTYPFSNFGVFWKDNFLASSDLTIRHQLKDGPRGRHMIIQWTNTTDGTYQVVFWESGGMDYRYRTAGSGSGATIGWQTRDRALLHNLNGSRAAVSGGLANRSWRYFEKAQPDTGSLTIPINRTTIFTLCGVGPFGRDCQRKTVTVQ